MEEESLRKEPHLFDFSDPMSGSPSRQCSPKTDHSLRPQIFGPRLGALARGGCGADAALGLFRDAAGGPARFTSSFDKMDVEHDPLLAEVDHVEV